MSATQAPAAPVGVYDSGVGGLSVLRVLRARLPHESFIYVADSGHAPYGDRTHDFIATRAGEVAGFFQRCHAKALVLACNTASVVAARTLRTLQTLPVIAMEPAIKPATASTRSKVVIVLATTTTIASDAVERLCRLHGEGVNLVLQACPGLVEQVERGAFDALETQRLLEQYLRPGLDAGADTIVLGCTHYAFLADPIASIAGPSVAILEPSEAIARQLCRVLQDTRRPGSGAGGAGSPVGAHGSDGAASSARSTTFYTSGSVATLRAFLAQTGEPEAVVMALPLLASAP